MTGTIVQINTSRGGIPKLPIGEGYLAKTGVDGDQWAHPKIHGGPRQAVLLIAAEVLEELRQAGYPVYPGALGENLTVQGLDRRAWRIGQRFEAGEALIELTKLRAPCETLNVFNGNGRSIQKAIYDSETKAGNPTSELWGKSGFYASVVKEGRIVPGDTITLVDHDVEPTECHRL